MKVPETSAVTFLRLSYVRPDISPTVRPTICPTYLKNDFCLTYTQKTTFVRPITWPDQPKNKVDLPYPPPYLFLDDGFLLRFRTYLFDFIIII